MEGSPVPWCCTGRYLDHRPLFTLDPLFHAGCYYVQEASSMLLEQAFARTGLAGQDVLALDLCAAPGGKSTHLASLLSARSLLVCNELDTHRRAVLSENVWKQGAANTLIAGSDPADLEALPDRFDLILVDAPCSGEGMFRKDAFAREQWSQILVDRCAATQARILEHAWHALRQGGWLIYSTCTWETKENEDQVRRLTAQGATHVPIRMDPAWGVMESDAGYRCYPHLVNGEGFFLALLQKPGLSIDRDFKLATPPSTEFHNWFEDPSERSVVIDDDQAWSYPSRWSTEVELLRERLKVVSPGIPIAERKGDHWRPHAALALNDILRRGRYRAIDLGVNDALSYLRGESLSLVSSGGVPATGERTRLITYQGHPLGSIYAAGEKRWNNGWPKPWRIRMR